MKKVTAHKGSCIGCIITEFFYECEIVKENKKSVRVNIVKTTKKESGKKVLEFATSNIQTFSFWKEVNGKKFFKNSIYGIIEM